MLKSTTSTLEFKSNIYPVESDQILTDESFLKSLRDPYAISEFARKAYRYFPTPLQREINRQVGIKCSFSPEGDFCWGTVMDDGEEKVVCKCENYACRLFSQCRPDAVVPEQTAEQNENPEIEPCVRPEDIVVKPSISAAQDSRPAEERLEGLQDPSPEEVRLKSLPDTDADEPSLEQTEGDSSNAACSPEEAFFQLGEHSADETIEEGDKNRGATEPPGPDEGIEGRYDAQQAQVVCADTSAKLYVNAGPGSGKTHSLIEKIKYLLEAKHVEPENMTVLSFTRAAVAVIQNRLKEAAEHGEIHAIWQDVDVTTFDKLCTRILFYGADGDKARESRISKLGYDERIAEAQNLIARQPELLDGCEHLIVDETQDLVGVRAGFVLTLLRNLPERCGFTLLGDRCQSIYDYQVNDGEISSTAFYERVLDEFSPTEILLGKNYRQKSSYPLDLLDMRKALLTGNLTEANRSISTVEELLGMPEVPIRKINTATLTDKSRRGTIGILTRTNDEALSVESALWKIGVPSLQKRSDAGDLFSRCIADAFISADGASLSKEEFDRLSAAHDPNRDGRIWKGLMRLDGFRLNGERMMIRDALLALSGTTPSSELSAERETPCPITVSTVHAAKGREFDNVWVLAEDLAQFASADDLEEKKVAYVGLSRGSEDIRIQCLDERVSSGRKTAKGSYKMYDRDRWYKFHAGRRRTSKPRLTNIEIRNEIDIDFRSFRFHGKAQELFRDGGIEGAPLRLIRRGAGQEIYYEIALEDDENLILGKMTRLFVDDCRKCTDYKNRADVIPPDAFDEIYIDRVVTCVGRSAEEASYDRSFGDMAVWYGIAIGGYAHRDDSQGY